VIELSDGDEFDLRIAPVAKKLGDATVRMLAYNGSIPGPILKVPQDSEFVVNVQNRATWKPPCTGTDSACEIAMTDDGDAAARSGASCW
jgi:hypothetical protein